MIFQSCFKISVIAKSKATVRKFNNDRKLKLNIQFILNHTLVLYNSLLYSVHHKCFHIHVYTNHIWNTVGFFKHTYIYMYTHAYWWKILRNQFALNWLKNVSYGINLMIHLFRLFNMHVLIVWTISKVHSMHIGRGLLKNCLNLKPFKFAIT